MFVFNFYVLDVNISEMDLNSYLWMMVIVIEDDDLMFGGKFFSVWYEEDCCRFSFG